MKLKLSADTFKNWIGAESYWGELKGTIDHIAYDTRIIGAPEGLAFFALPGDLRDGHSFLDDAYHLGVRVFVVSKPVGTYLYPDALIFHVDNTQEALMKLAGAHRRTFSYPVVAIIGSSGKTTVKEWTYHLLSQHLRVVRSPKSFNSKLGVALSLLEMSEDKDLALIEVGLSVPGDSTALQQMLVPNYAVITGVSNQLLRNFSSREDLLSETLALTSACKSVIYTSQLNLNDDQKRGLNGTEINTEGASVQEINSLLAQKIATLFIDDESLLNERLRSLPKLALRMETFEGLNNTTVINDAYNLDMDALEHSLAYQLGISQQRPRVVIIGLDKKSKEKKAELETLIERFHPDEVQFLEDPKDFVNDFENSVILIKGTRVSNVQKVAAMLRIKKHSTSITIDLGALRTNVLAYQNVVGTKVQLLAMVKASSYGSGIDKVATFLEACGIRYFGVAYADEGVEMRKLGIKAPILIMNAEEDGFEDCIRFGLEPAIHSFEQLDAFISECILQQKRAYPIHLKIETGMKRLGFELGEIDRLVEMLKSQPEVHVKSVYSHLADADNPSSNFSKEQMQRFDSVVERLNGVLPYSFDTHIQNSEGMVNFPSDRYSMARLGIGMFGVTDNAEMKQLLKPVLGWRSSVSQVKHIYQGESIGYSRSFVAPKDMTIAIVPVGYADGFRRNLSNGKGGVFIRDKYCPTVARVCMDMIMVDISSLKVEIGEEVEIIGTHQSIEDLAIAMDTIPYEVMTGISKRVARVYLD